MVAEVTHYVCQSCGGEFPKWSGQCANCGAWNSLVETLVSTTSRAGRTSSGSRAGRGAKPLRLSEVATGNLEGRRISSGISELDRVLGGDPSTHSTSSGQAGLGQGMVPGSVMLLAGEPGIGKSTLLTQLALRVARGSVNPSTSSGHGGPVARGDKRLQATSYKPQATAPAVLYVCGEESPEQIKLRVDRLLAARGPVNPSTSSGHGVNTWHVARGSNHKPQATGYEHLLLLPETDVDAVCDQLSAISRELGLAIVDSIQTMQTADLSGMAGSVGQIRESAFRLINMAKKTGVPLFIVGHVTKEGSIAGPKVLEHMVDVVLELTGETTHEFRILRGLKNRFGAIDEVGVFTLGDSGMEGVANPSDVFLGRRRAVPGSVVVVTMAGLRPVLTEVQALVTPTTLAVPRRVSTGVDQRRVVLISAVLTRHCGLRLNESDIFVRVSGGLTLAEPAGDLGVALAIASAALGKSLPTRAVSVGEVGLLGEIRPVGRMKQRVSEATKQGYSRIISAERFETLAGLVRKLLR